jgi:hypothetical protein
MGYEIEARTVNAKRASKEGHVLMVFEDIRRRGLEKSIKLHSEARNLQAL